MASVLPRILERGRGRGTTPPIEITQWRLVQLTLFDTLNTIVLFGSQ